MTIIEQLIELKLASNPFHASNMLNKLQCGSLATDEERIERCRLYCAWKATGENRAICTKNAIEGIVAPEPMIDETQKQADEYLEAEAEHYADYFKDVEEGKAG